MSSTNQPLKRSTVGLTVTFIFLIALAVRLVAIGVTRHYVESDGAGRYVPQAIEMSDENILVFLEKNISPLYPAFLSTVYWIYGERQEPNTSVAGSVQIPLMVVQGFLGALACVFYFLTYNIIFKFKYALLPSAFASIYWPLAIQPTVSVRSEVLSVILMSLLVWVLVKLTKTHTSAKKKVMLSGCLAGLCFLLTLNHRMYIILLSVVPTVLTIAPSNITLRQRLICVLLPFAIISATVNLTWMNLLGTDTLATKGQLGLNLLHSVMSVNSVLAKDEPLEKSRGVADEPFLRKTQIQRLGLDTFNSSIAVLKQNVDDGVMMKWALTLIAEDPIRYMYGCSHRFVSLWLSDLLVIQYPEPEPPTLHLRPHSYFKKNRQWALFAITSVGYVLGWFAFAGMLFSWRRLRHISLLIVLVVLFLSIVHAHAFYIVALHAYMLMFSAFAVQYFYLRTIRKVSQLEIMERMFRE